MGIADRIVSIRKKLPAGVTLVAVSKTHPPGDIMEAYREGQRDFGESRPQEMCAKHEQLPQDIRWHQIGHLQTNKVRSIIPFVHLIHSVDSQRLLDVIDREAARAERRVGVLLEVRIAVEESKHGWDAKDLEAYISGGQWRTLEHVDIRGMMAIASNTGDMRQVRGEFREVNRMFTEAKATLGPQFDILSLGMTSDYGEAIEEGSTMVRIGSLIFGQR